MAASSSGMLWESSSIKERRGGQEREEPAPPSPSPAPREQVTHRGRGSAPCGRGWDAGGVWGRREPGGSPHLRAGEGDDVAPGLGGSCGHRSGRCGAGGRGCSLHSQKISPFSIYYSLVINNPTRPPHPRQNPPFPRGCQAGAARAPLPLLGPGQPRIPQFVPGHIPARRAIPVIPARRQHWAAWPLPGHRLQPPAQIRTNCCATCLYFFFFSRILIKNRAPAR